MKRIIAPILLLLSAMLAGCNSPANPAGGAAAPPREDGTRGHTSFMGGSIATQQSDVSPKRRVPEPSAISL